MAREMCGSYQHEGYPTEDDKPCTECNGTGWVTVSTSAALAGFVAVVLDRGSIEGRRLG